MEGDFDEIPANDHSFKRAIIYPMLSPFDTAKTLVQSLYKQGVRHAILSPGSRSTPLTLAFVYHNGFSKKVVLDERSAAFIALGIAKETGFPAVLVCTSGTAAANYFPTIVEAKQSGVPLIVLTADRPPNLRGIGDSQTIDQIKLYGNYSVFFHETGEPANDASDLKRLQYAVQQAVSDSIRKGGAAHLNVPFRKPLEPATEMISLYQKENVNHSNNFIGLVSTNSRTVSPSKEIVNLINHSDRPLIIAGPANNHHSNAANAFQIAEKIHAPVIAEAGSRFDRHPSRIYRFDQLLRNNTILSSLKPDLILRFGDQPFSKSLLTSVDEWEDVEIIRFDARNSWQDSAMGSISNQIIDLHQNDAFDIDLIKTKTDAYLNRWIQKESIADFTLNKALENSELLCDGHVFHHISASIPDNWKLMFSNSLPVRDAVLFGNPGKHVVVNRGAAGIDGILSTAIGSSLANDEPICCVIGDLAFLHDSNALLSLKHISSPFVIVVINNNGGNIFRMLPIYELQETYQTYFETPQQVDIEWIANAHKITYRKIDDVSKLREFSFDEMDSTQPLLIECLTDPDESMVMRKKLWVN